LSCDTAIAEDKPTNQANTKLTILANELPYGLRFGAVEVNTNQNNPIEE